MPQGGDLEALEICKFAVVGASTLEKEVIAGDEDETEPLPQFFQQLLTALPLQRNFIIIVDQQYPLFPVQLRPGHHIGRGVLA